MRNLLVMWRSLMLVRLYQGKYTIIMGLFSESNHKEVSC